MLEGYHPPLEEYLEAVHDLQEEGVPVIQARLVERLGHSAPTVSEMIRKLRDEGYLLIEGRSIVLTASGRVQAEKVVRKHRLAERLLTDILDLPWHASHLEATRWEHVISDEVAEKISEKLNNPTTCPHGNPIPGTSYDKGDQQPIANFEVGDIVTMNRVTEQVEFNTEALTMLGTNGFTVGKSAKIIEKKLNKDMKIEVNGNKIQINDWLSKLIFVTKNS